MKEKKKAGEIIPEQVTSDATENTGSISLEDFLSKTPKERDEIYSALDPKEKDKILKALSIDERLEMIVTKFRSPQGKIEYDKIKKSSDEYSRALLASLIVPPEIRESIITHQTKSFS